MYKYNNNNNNMICIYIYIYTSLSLSLYIDIYIYIHIMYVYTCLYTHTTVISHYYPVYGISIHIRGFQGYRAAGNVKGPKLKQTNKLTHILKQCISRDISKQATYIDI